LVSMVFQGGFMIFHGFWLDSVFFHGFWFFSFSFIGGSHYATMMVPPACDLCTHLILNGI